MFHLSLDGTHGHGAMLVDVAIDHLHIAGWRRPCRHMVAAHGSQVNLGVRLLGPHAAAGLAVPRGRLQRTMAPGRPRAHVDPPACQCGGQ